MAILRVSMEAGCLVSSVIVPETLVFSRAQMQEVRTNIRSGLCFIISFIEVERLQVERVDPKLVVSVGITVRIAKMAVALKL